MTDLKKESVIDHVVDPKTNTAEKVSQEQLEAEQAKKAREEVIRQNVAAKLKAMNENTRPGPWFFNTAEDPDKGKNVEANVAKAAPRRRHR